jgi:hypothetical protein
MGYEYEIQSPNYGLPVSDGWTHIDPDTYAVVTPRAATPQHPIKNLPNFYHLQYESLGDGLRGYEIKSPVAPLSIHKQIVKRYLFPNVRFNNKPNGHQNYGGIHVSISNDKYTRPHHEKVFKFMHLDMPREFQLKLSEREAKSLNTFAQQTKHKLFRDANAYGSTICWGHHYAVINRENVNRFELRLFAAQKHLLIPALEMADSLFSLAALVDKLTMENWTRFVASKLKYADLNILVKKAMA